MKCLLLPALVLFHACIRDEGKPATPHRMKTVSLSPLPMALARPPLNERWPQVFLAEGGDRFLWGREQELFHVEGLEHGLAVIEPKDSELTRGLDRLIAASRGSDGTLALLDASGQIVVHQPPSMQTRRFKVQTPDPVGDVAVTKDLVYVLFQGELNAGAAVAAYDFAGSQAGQWGERPAGAIIQTNLGGGGIAVCPDGAVFYSYINDPGISRLEAEGRVKPVGKPAESFEVLAPRKVHRAYQESLETRSVAPLVKAGLGASRVMTLLCGDDGLLLRQVAQPLKRGAHVELWDPASEELLGVIPVDRSVLLAVSEQVLYLGALSDGQKLTLERIRYQVESPRLGSAAE